MAQLVRKADELNIKSDSCEAQNDLGSTLYGLGRMDEAEQCLRAALALRPEFPVALYNLGVVLRARRKPDESADCFRRAVAIDPQFADAHNNLGTTLLGLGRLDEAERSLRLALALRPAYGEASNNLGTVLQALGRAPEAEQYFRSALVCNPDLAASHNNLGNVLQLQGRLEEAEQSFRRALHCSPGYVTALSNLGSVLREQGKLGDAENVLREALAIRPEFASAHTNLALTLQIAGRLAQAKQCALQAVVFEPELAEAHHALGNILLDHGEADDAVQCFQKAAGLKSDLAAAWSNAAFALNYIPGANPATVYAAHREYARRFCESAVPPAPHANIPDPQRGLRVGYLSGDLRNHSIARFLEPVLRHHDRGRFEVFCYSNHPRGDAVSARLRAYGHAWREVYAIDDEALEALIRRDAVDLLVDLSGHSRYNRLPVFGRKPAPVQLTWLGYLNTTGLEAMDYRITDRHASPEGLLEAFHSERMLRLPDSQWCYSPPEESVEVAPAPAARRGFATFGVFCNLAKITREAIRIWSLLLARVPDSRLMVMGRGLESIEGEFLARFASQGIGRERIELRNARPFREYLEMHSSVDIVLDTFPYAGGTTTCHALWMGVPVVSLAGASATSRSGASLLAVLDLGELLAQSPAQYVEIAAGLAADIPRLERLRAGMRARMLGSALMDAERFTRNLEQALRDAWRGWCEAR